MVFVFEIEGERSKTESGSLGLLAPGQSCASGTPGLGTTIYHLLVDKNLEDGSRVGGFSGWESHTTGQDGLAGVHNAFPPSLVKKKKIWSSRRIERTHT